MKLWNNQETNDDTILKIQSFTVGDDVILDQQLVPYDVKASMAHARGLQKVGLITVTECDQLVAKLHEITELWEEGTFLVRQEQEDCHTAIEAYLTDSLGEIGKKIHTGRSRNDQVLAALRLYQKDQLQALRKKGLQLADSFLRFAERHADVAMPGFTHTQPAMLSSVGLWSTSFAELLSFDLIQLMAAYALVDHSPLGTAAGYGVNLPLDRPYTAQDMGFSDLVINPIAAQNSRVKIETAIVNALESLASTLSQFASDVVQFTGLSLNYLRLSSSLCTGSSIMPQKHNPDSAELLRAYCGEFNGLGASLRATGRNLTTGYHRDMQLTKKYVMRGLELMHQLIDIAALILDGLEPQKEILEAACGPELFAVDLANSYVQNGMSFRDAYFKVKTNLSHLKTPPLKEALMEKSHIGGTGNLGIDLIRARIM